MSPSSNRIFTGSSWIIASASKGKKRSKIIAAHYHIFPHLGSSPRSCG